MLAYQCGACGAPLEDNLTCESVFNEFLALEMTDPEYGAVHFLTVACYMIQHGKYSDEALVWIEQRLRDYFEKGIPAGEIRKRAEMETSQDKRTWKVIRQKSDPPQAKIPWSMTIIDVANQFHNAEDYRELVRQWAVMTLAEMQPLLPKD